MTSSKATLRKASAKHWLWQITEENGCREVGTWLQEPIKMLVMRRSGSRTGCFISL